MNQERFSGIWKQTRGAVKVLFGSLTGDQQAIAAATRDVRAGKIQARLGVSREHAARQLAEFYQRNRDWTSLSR